MNLPLRARLSHRQTHQEHTWTLSQGQHRRDAGTNCVSLCARAQTYKSVHVLAYVTVGLLMCFLAEGHSVTNKQTRIHERLRKEDKNNKIKK